MYLANQHSKSLGYEKLIYKYLNTIIITYIHHYMAGRRTRIQQKWTTEKFLQDVFNNKSVTASFKNLPDYIKQLVSRDNPEIKQFNSRQNKFVMCTIFEIDGYKISATYSAEDSLSYEITFNGSPLIEFQLIYYKAKSPTPEYLSEDTDYLGRIVNYGDNNIH
jgi:hypothetical protein